MAEGARDYGLYDRAIRALSSGRDWWRDTTDPNRPRQRKAVDVNLPVDAPEEPWYKKIPAPLEIAEQVGRAAVEPIKTQAKSAGGKLAGALGATSEASGRAFGAALDVADPRNTGSEKKPATDIVWEGLKGIRSGYEKGLEATSASQEFTKRAPEGTLSGANPVQRGMLGLGLDVVTDPTNLIPEKYLGTGAAALLGAGDVSAAWLPPKLFKASRGIEGFTSRMRNQGDAAKILDVGFGTKGGTDVLENWGHASSYTPAAGKAARKAGKAPRGTSNRSYSQSNYAEYLPLDFEDSVKVLDIQNAPVPREDIDEILKTLHPDKDKDLIQRIEDQYAAQAPYVIEHSKIRSGEIPVKVYADHLKKIQKNPEALTKIRKLNKTLAYESGTTYGARYGEHGSHATGNAPLNQPSQTGQYGAIHYSDYNASSQPSIAFDPRQTLFAPPESQKAPLDKVPWQKGKLAPAETPSGYWGGTFPGTMPPDAPGGISSPLPGQGPLPPVQAPVATPLNPQQDATAWAAQNLPKSWANPPMYKGQPIPTYEQSTIKELVAAGRPLTKDQTKKLEIIKQFESGYYTPEDWTSVGTSTPQHAEPISEAQSHADSFKVLFDDPSFMSDEMIEQFHMLSPDAQAAFAQSHPEDYSWMTNTMAWEDYQNGKGYSASIGAVPPPQVEDLTSHHKDVESILQDYGIHFPPTYENFTPKTAVQVHENAINYLTLIGANDAADDVQKLWDMKKSSELIEGIANETPALDNFANDVPAVPTPSNNYVSDMVNASQNPNNPENIQGAWGMLLGAEQMEFSQNYPELFEQIKPIIYPASWSPELPSALPEGIPGFDDDIVKAPNLEGYLGEPLPSVSAPDAPGKATLENLDTYGSLDYLKNTYPHVAENFGKSSGTEMGSIESHTKDVLKQWETQLAPEEFEEISARYGTDVNALMNVVLPLHDIGKPQALASGDKTLQHSFTVPILEDILQKEGFDKKDIDLARELFNHDMIGSLLQGTSKFTPQEVAEQIAAKADKIGMNPSDFAKLQLAFFQADASAYPFVTQFMKQMPSGQWISGSPKVKPIEDLIAGIKSAPVAAPEEFKLKDANPNLAGMYSKKIYTKGGKDYIFKVADPSKAHMPEMETRANKVAALGGLYDAGTTVQTLEGKLGSMQPLIGNRSDWPTLRHDDLTKLSSADLRDIIRHHPVDWLTSNHDAHKGQWLKTPNGIIEIDRGQAWKHFGEDKLDVNYHPNEKFGEQPPIYNQIAKLYKEGKLPQLNEGDIDSVIWASVAKLIDNKQPVMNNIESALAKFNKSDKIPIAHERFNTLMQDLDKFWKK